MHSLFRLRFPASVSFRSCFAWRQGTSFITHSVECLSGPISSFETSGLIMICSFWIQDNLTPLETVSSVNFGMCMAFVYEIFFTSGTALESDWLLQDTIISPSYGLWGLLVGILKLLPYSRISLFNGKIIGEFYSVFKYRDSGYRREHFLALGLVRPCSWSQRRLGCQERQNCLFSTCAVWVRDYPKIVTVTSSISLEEPTLHQGLTFRSAYFSFGLWVSDAHLTNGKHH